MIEVAAVLIGFIAGGFVVALVIGAAIKTAIARGLGW